MTNINWKNPLAPHLDFVWMPIISGPGNNGSQHRPTYSRYSGEILTTNVQNTVVQSLPSKWGTLRGLRQGGGTPAYWSSNVSVNFGSAPMTFFMVVAHHDVANDHGFWGQGETLQQFWWDTSGSAINAFGLYDGTVTTGAITSVPVDEVHTVAVTYNPADDTTYGYQDGVLVHSKATWAQNTTGAFLIGQTGDNDKQSDKTVFLVYRIAKVLTAMEHAVLAANPWQLFKSRLMFAHVARYDPTIVLEQTGPVTINESISFGIDAGTTQVNILTAGVSQAFTIDLAQTQDGSLGTTTLTITLVDSVGTQLSSLTGLSWAWFDQATPDIASTPIVKGAGETTDSSGVLSIDITGTTLTTGQTGMLALRDSTGMIYALYRITL